MSSFKGIVAKQLLVAIDFHGIFFSKLLKSMATGNCLVTNAVQIIFFEATWGRVNDNKIVIFGWTIPL